MNEAPARTAADGELAVYLLPVEGMHCGRCEARVQAAVEALPGVVAVDADAAGDRATVTVHPGGSTRRAVAAAIAEAGYAVPDAPCAPKTQSSEGRRPVEPTLRDTGSGSAAAPASASDGAATPDLAADDCEGAAQTAPKGAAAGDRQIDLAVDGMTCAACVRTVEHALNRVAGVQAANVNFATGRARVHADSRVGAGALEQAVRAVGYGAREAGSEPGLQRSQARDWWLFAVCAVLTVPLVAQMALPPFGIDKSIPPLVQLALATPVQLLAGWRFYRGAVGSLAHGSANMDLLVALGTTAAFGLSLWTMAQMPAALLSLQGPHLYFEAAAAILTLVLLGRLLEERARRRTSAALRALQKLRPDTARLERDGAVEEIPATQLVPGDVAIVRPGERLPADGTVLEGRSEADESMLTGESLPVDKEAGSPVIGGTLNGSGLLRVEVTASAGQSALARIVEAMESAQASKPSVQRLVDRVSAVFVPAVVLLAIATFLGWRYWAGAEMTEAILNAVAVLVIACPCALGLATPIAIVMGTGVAARRGVLIKDAEALERARELDTVVFDKTGTLTEGQPELVHLAGTGGVDRATLLRLAAGAQQGSEHPLARALRRAASEDGLDLPAVRDFQGLAGRGLEAAVGDTRVLLGSRRLMNERGVPTEALEDVAHEQEAHGRSVAWIARLDGERGTLLGLAGFGDAARDGAAEAVSRLGDLGLDVVLLTGDNRRAAEAMAARLGIARVVPEVLPEDKAAEIARLRDEGRSVAMVGDGVNDAPALAAADLGIAMGEGSDVALEAAAIALLRSDPRLVPEAVVLARATRRKIRQNLFWAFVYNTLGLPLAALGLLAPVVAGAAMAASSVSVVANTLLLGRFRRPRPTDG